MDYAKGTCSRVFWVRFDHNDDLLEKLKELVVKENIRQAWFWCLGALRHAQIVTGPRESAVPPIPMWHHIIESHEVIGVGNITFHEDTGQPVIHLHASLGRADDTRVGCIRKSTEVYLTIECAIMEFSGFEAVRKPKEGMGIDLIEFKRD